jgi:hypothetical protein
MERLVSSLADMVLETAVVVGLDSLADGVDLRSSNDPSWVVAVTEDDAVGAVLLADELVALPKSTSVRDAIRGQRAVVTAHPACSVVAAISSWAFTQASDWADQNTDRSVVIVVRDRAGVVGVWEGDDLDEVLEIGTTRTGADLTMPGDVHIPEYVRRCTFEVERVRCDAVRSFAEPPPRPLPCNNPRRLPTHEFGE